MNTNKDTVLRSVLEKLQGAISSHLLRNLAEEEVKLVGAKPTRSGNTVAQRIGGQSSARPSVVTTKASVAIWHNFPRSVPGYATMVNLLVDCCYDSTVFFNYLLSWLSDKVTPVTPYDYHSFVTSISSGPLKPTQQDPVDLVINIVVADIIATAYSRSEPQPPEQLQLLSETILKFPYLYQSVKAEPNNTLRAVATTQWSVVLGLISPSLLNYGNHQFLGGMMVKLRQEPNYFIPFVKNIRLSLRTEREIAESTFLIEKFVNIIMLAYNQKNNADIKTYLSLFCDILSSVDLSDKSDLFVKAKIDSKTLEKLAKNEDLESVTIRYKAVLMAVGASDYFTGNVQEVTQKILKRLGAHSKYSDEFLEALGILFRGAYSCAKVSWLPGVDALKEIDIGEMYNTRKMPSHLYPDMCRIVESSSPFIHAPFFEKMRIQRQASFEILRSITRNMLSSKFKLWSNYKVGTQAVADVIVQAATHSFDYLTQEILPTLLNGTICDAIVAFQSLAMLASPTLKYATMGHCFQADKKDPTAIANTLNQEIIKTINASIRILGSNLDLTDQSQENRDNVGCYLTPGTFYFKGFESLFAQAIEAQRPSIAFANVDNNRGKLDGSKNGLLPLSHIDEILKSTLSRIQKLVFLDEAERREKNYKSLTQCTKKTSKVVEQWVSADCAFSFPNFVTGGPQIPEEPKPRVRKPVKDERLRAYQVILLREMLTAIVNLPTQDWQFLELIPFGNDKIKPVPLLAYMILHQDDDLSNLVFLFYQRVIVEFPQFRTIIIADLIQVFHSIHFSKQHLKLFVFSQISVLLDLWNAVYYTQLPALNKNGNKVNSNIIVSEGELENLIILIQNLEQCALYFLCSPIPDFRLCSMDILNSVSLLYFLHCRNSLENKDQIRISSILKTHSHYILQEARFAFLNECAINLHDNAHVRHDTPLEITIRDISGSTHERLWTFVLNQIGKAIATYDDSASIVRLRTMTKILDDFELEGYVSSQQIHPVANPDGMENAVLFAPTLYTNSQMFLFSLANSKLRTEGAEQKILRHLAAWGDLMADSASIVLSRVQAIKMISWDSATIILSSLWGWYSKISNPKKKSELRPYVAYILYSISMHSDFTKGITTSRAVGGCYLQFIEEIPPAFEPLAKASDLTHIFYYLCNTGIVINVMVAMHKSMELSLIGPLRKQFVSQPHWVLSEHWQTKHKPALVNFFRERIPLDLMSQRFRQDRGEVDKMLAKVDNKEAKEKIRVITSRQLKLISDRSALAIAKLAHVFPMIDVPNALISNSQPSLPKFIKEIDAMVMPVQRLSPPAQLLECYVALEEELIPTMMERAYITNDIMDKVFYCHSIYAQFVAPEYFRIDNKYSNNFKRSESKQKDQKGMIAKYSVLQSQLAGLNPHQQQPVKDQSENLLPWTREESITYNADSIYYKTTHAMLDQFVESRIVQEEIFNNACKQPLTSFDSAFTKKVLGFAGSLLNFLFYSLIQPEVSIRVGAFHSLLRLGPIEFGKCVELPESPAIKKIRLSIAKYEANVNSPLDEVWFAAAVSISEILCINCAALTLDFFNAWISVWEHLTPLEQVRLGAIIQCWGKNIALSETGAHSSTLLESLFATVTIVACEERNVVGAAVFSVWESFSIVSPSNMAFTVKFLVLRGVTKGSVEICRRLVQQLAMKAHRTTVLDTLLVNLSFPGMMENINRANQERLNRLPQGDKPKSPRAIEGPTLQDQGKGTKGKGRGRGRGQASPNGDEAPKKKEDKTSMEQIFSLMRKATVAILADLIGDDINSIFPSLHILLQYTILYLDQDVHLLHVLVSILRAVLAIFVNGINKDNQESVQECISIIQDIVTLTQIHRHSFIQWDVTANKNAGEQREIQQGILKGFPATQLPGQSSRESGYVGESRVHSQFLDLASQKLHISKLVDYLIKIFSHPLLAKSFDENLSKNKGGQATGAQGIKNIIHLWGQQCILWGILFPDSLISTKSLEIYSRIVKPCSMETIIKLSTNLHYSVERLQTISTVSKAIQKGALISEFFTPDAQDVDLLRVRVVVIVESLIQIARVTESENYLQFLFWISTALMETSPLTQPGVYNAGVNLMAAVVDSKVFKTIEPSAFKHYQKLSEKWKFQGVNTLLLQSLKSGKSDTNGANLVRVLLKCDNIPQEVLEPKRMNADLLDALWFLSLLPWLHYNLYFPYFISTNCGDEFSSRNAARALFRSVCEKFNQPNKKLQYGIYKFITKFNTDYITNKQKSGGEDTFNSFPFSLSTSTSFLTGICQVLAASLFPTHAVATFSFLVDSFHQTPKFLHNVLAAIATEFLNHATKDTAITVQGLLTDLLVFAVKDSELAESAMTKKLISLANTSESPTVSQKWHPNQLQNVEVALLELVNYLKQRSNRHSVMQVEQGGDKDKRTEKTTKATKTKEPEPAPESNAAPVRGRVTVGKPVTPSGTQPSSSQRPTASWIGARTEETKGRTDSKGVGGFAGARPSENMNSSRDDLQKTRSSPSVGSGVNSDRKSAPHPASDTTSPRERMMRLQQKVSVGQDQKPNSNRDSGKPLQKQSTVIDDGLASLRQLAGTLQFSLSSSTDSDSYSSSDDRRGPEDDSEDFIEGFQGMPTNDEFDNMRALLMNSITNATDEYEDDDSGTYETDTDGSDDLDDLRTSLAGLENF